MKIQHGVYKNLFGLTKGIYRRWKVKQCYVHRTVSTALFCVLDKKIHTYRPRLLCSLERMKKKEGAKGVKEVKGAEKAVRPWGVETVHWT